MKQIEQALAGIVNLGIDTAPFIYFVERNPLYFPTMHEIIQRMDLGIIVGFSSVITLTEVLTLPKRLGKNAIEADYRDLLTNSRNFSLIPIDLSIAEQAAELRARYQILTPDALQIAAAISSQCQAFLTNDKKLKRVLELRILLLEDLISSGED